MTAVAAQEKPNNLWETHGPRALARMLEPYNFTGVTCPKTQLEHMLPNKALLFPSPENTHNTQRTEPPVFVPLLSKRRPTDKYFPLIYQEMQEIILLDSHYMCV